MVIVIFAVLVFFSSSPTDFPKNSLFTVEKGQGANSLATDLYNRKIIRSPFLFKIYYVLNFNTRGIKAGDYVLNNNEYSFNLVRRMIKGKYNLQAVKITIPEGLNIKETVNLLAQKFSKINLESFVRIAGDKEGYLFPDTYLFLPNVEVNEIVEIMEKNFYNKISTINSDLENFKQPLENIIKMASIVEAEARTEETRRIVAGILWRRFEIGMPLQVDSSFKYINNKTTADLTLADLKIDSPYNSYLYKGFPPTPICNPGLDSILATIRPIKTNYLYFLTDNKGNMHYAETHQKHLQNKELYLK